MFKFMKSWLLFMGILMSWIKRVDQLLEIGSSKFIYGLLWPKISKGKWKTCRILFKKSSIKKRIKLWSSSLILKRIVKNFRAWFQEKKRKVYRISRLPLKQKQRSREESSFTKKWLWYRLLHLRWVLNKKSLGKTI